MSQFKALMFTIVLVISLLVLVVLVVEVIITPQRSIIPNSNNTGESIWRNVTSPPRRTRETVTQCTADVKRCPNGSYVNRVPPQCEFAPCGQ